VLDLEKEQEICHLYKDEEKCSVELGKQFHVSPSTIIRVVRKYGVERGPSAAAKLRSKQHPELIKNMIKNSPMGNFGRDNPHYKNGSSKWNRKVLEKFSYTCQDCGLYDIELLEAHHIIPVSVDKSLQFDLNNGIALCPNCHKRRHIRMNEEITESID